jgi:hypothetical protein
MRRAAVTLVMAPVLMLAVAGPALAEITALGTRSGDQAPALTDGRVVWSQRAGRSGIRIFSRLAQGGPVQTAGKATLPSADGGPSYWRLVAAPGWLGVRVAGRKARRMRLLGGAPGALLPVVRSGVALGALQGPNRDTWPWPPGGFVTLERRPGAGETETARELWVTEASGARRQVALPPNADPITLAVGGTNAAVAIVAPDKGLQEVAVLDLTTGAVQRRVAAGPFSGIGVINSVALSPEGELAITVEDGNGSDGLGWAAATAAQLQIVTIDDRFGLVNVAHGRIAMVGPNGPQMFTGERILVFEPRAPDEKPNVVFRSPPMAHVDALDFDGAHVAWASRGCQLVANATLADSNLVLPPGPCVRTEVATLTFGPPKLRGAAIGIQIDCLTAPTRRCPLTVRALAFPRGGGRARQLGVLRRSVPRGAKRLLYVPISRRDANRIRREQLEPLFAYTVVDPDGKRRTELTA